MNETQLLIRIQTQNKMAKPLTEDFWKKMEMEYWAKKGMFIRTANIAVKKASWRRNNKLNGFRGEERLLTRTYDVVNGGYKNVQVSQQIFTPHMTLTFEDTNAVEIDFDEVEKPVEKPVERPVERQVVLLQPFEFVKNGREFGIDMAYPTLGWLGRKNYTTEEFLGWKKRKDRKLKDMTQDEKNFISRIWKRQHGRVIDKEI